MNSVVNTKPAPIIILNGTSSTGKSTLASLISNEIENSVIVRCDEVAVRVFDRLRKEGGYEIPENTPKDLMSLCSSIHPLNKVLDDEVNIEMYQEIRLNADQGKVVINDNAWVREKDIEDFNHELAGYKVFRIFVHSSLEGVLTKVLKRNLSPHVIDHRSITLPYFALPLMYKAQLSKDENTLEIWDKEQIVLFMNRLKDKYESIKQTYNPIWQKEGDSFFSSIDDFYKYFRLDEESSVPITPLNPYDHVVNTSNMTTEECAKKIATLVFQG